MRTIRIIRPKRMESGANKLSITVDGNKAGDLGNGKEIVINADEKAHEISGKGGLLAGKGFAFQYHIPAGSCSYVFQMDMLNSKNGYTPVLRPTNGDRLKDDAAVRTVIGVTAVQTLLSDSVRGSLSADTLITLNLLGDKWQLIASEAGSQRVLVEQPYGSTQVTGVLLQGLASSIDKMFYDTPERRQETLDYIFNEYLRYLPDYEPAGQYTLRKKA